MFWCLLLLLVCLCLFISLVFGLLVIFVVLSLGFNLIVWVLVFGYLGYCFYVYLLC